MAIERTFTAHARTRMAQRGISEADVDYVLLNGLRIHSGGVQHVHLREKDIPLSERRDCDRRNGIQVLLDTTGRTVVTVYKNRSRDTLKKARRKSRYDRKPPAVTTWQ